MRFNLLLVTSSLLLLLFSIIGTYSRVLNNPKNISEVTSIESSNNPVIKDNPDFPILSAQGVIVTDIDSGIVLYEKNPDGVLYPASTTKIVTALVAIDNYNLNDILTFKLGNIDGQKMGLVLGEKIRVGDLIYGLLVQSANDAAELLAFGYPGGRNGFVEAMNIKAVELGLKNTVFKNPTGLDEEGHVTTARDLEIASRVAMQNDLFRTIVATKEKVVKSIDGKNIHELTNVNKLIGEVEGVLGVKTGWTEGARENLVTYLQRDGRTISLVILGSQDRFGETKELLDWIFNSYSWKTVAS